MSLTLTPDEIGNQGEAIFEARIKASLTGRRPEEFLAIDINSGEYEVAADDVTPGRRLRQRRPDAIIFLRRVGSANAYFIGSGERT